MCGKTRVVRLAATIALTWVALFAWHQFGRARRDSIVVLNQLQSGLSTSNPDSVMQSMATPAALQGRSAPEQAQFLRKALLDELSPEGLAVLEKHGRFGALTKIFPAEAESWASQAGVEPDDCVAFRMERNGHRAEVVLVESENPSSNQESHYRIVRINNVRQMAEPHP